MEIIYDGNAIQVMIDRVSDFQVVFSFASFVAHNNGGSAYGNGFLQKNGFTAVFFLTKISNWWQTKEFDEAINVVNKHTETIKRRVAYGQSMGGYGALLASGLLNSFVLVTAPQTNITNKNIPLHPVWKDEIARFPLVRDDVQMQIKKSPGVIVLYDPYDNIDRQHYSHISGAPNIKRLIMPFATHNIPKCMLEMGIFSDVISSLLKHDVSYINQARRKIRSKRLLSPTYVLRASIFILKRNSKFLKQRFSNALIGALSNPELKGSDLSHVFAVLTSDNFKNFWVKNSINIDGFNIETNNHVEIIEARFALFKSTGNDPQLIISTPSREHISTLTIAIYSSVKSQAVIYYSIKDGVRQFNSKQVIVRPVDTGYNKLIFILPENCGYPDIRFDPLSHEGLFSIASISVEYLNNPDVVD